jgi:hypothetical protein
MIRSSAAATAERSRDSVSLTSRRYESVQHLELVNRHWDNGNPLTSPPSIPRGLPAAASFLSNIRTHLSRRGAERPGRLARPFERRGKP